MFEARISVVTVLEGRVGVALDVGSMFREKVSYLSLLRRLDEKYYFNFISYKFSNLLFHLK